MGHIRKALEKGYSEHPRFACCANDMFEIFLRFGQCLCCLLPIFANRQPPCLHVKPRRLQDWEKLKKYVPSHKHGDVCPNGVPALAERGNDDNESDSE